LGMKEHIRGTWHPGHRIERASRHRAGGAGAMGTIHEGNARGQAGAGFHGASRVAGGGAEASLDKGAFGNCTGFDPQG
jgi:hypothetical protein